MVVPRHPKTTQQFGYVVLYTRPDGIHESGERMYATREAADRLRKAQENSSGTAWNFRVRKVRTDGSEYLDNFTGRTVRAR